MDDIVIFHQGSIQIKPTDNNNETPPNLIVEESIFHSQITLIPTNLKEKIYEYQFFKYYVTEDFPLDFFQVLINKNEKYNLNAVIKSASQKQDSCLVIKESKCFICRIEKYNFASFFVFIPKDSKEYDPFIPEFQKSISSFLLSLKIIKIKLPKFIFIKIILMIKSLLFFPSSHILFQS